MSEWTAVNQNSVVEIDDWLIMVFGIVALY